MAPNKAQIRAAAKQRRAQRSPLPPTAELLDYIMTNFQAGESIGSFLSKSGEIETTELISDLQNSYSLFAPVVVEDSLAWRSVTTEYKLGEYGIREPVSKNEIEVSELSCILLPALAIDLVGNRVGFGAGYFDRSLSATKAIKIALVYEADLVSEFEPDPHDVRVDLIATEQRLIKIVR
jgi:5-formyltetrahydrofolate cyclo-ligase